VRGILSVEVWRKKLPPRVKGHSTRVKGHSTGVKGHYLVVDTMN